MDNFWRKDSFGDADKIVIKVRHYSTFPNMDHGSEITTVGTRNSKEIVLEAAEKRAQPMHLRQRRRQKGLTTLINGEGATGRGIKYKGQKWSD